MFSNQQRPCYLFTRLYLHLLLIGRTRLEPVAIVILSSIMSVASVQLVAESIQTIISIAQGTYPGVDFDNVSIGVLGFTMRKLCYNFIQSAPSYNRTF